MRSASPVLAITVFLLATGAHAQPVPQGPPPPGQAAAPRPVPRSAEVAADRRVTFRLEAPKATTVLVNGDWPGGRGLAMSKDAAGLWTLTTGPLTPEIVQDKIRPLLEDAP